MILQTIDEKLKVDGEKRIDAAIKNAIDCLYSNFKDFDVPLSQNDIVSLTVHKNCILESENIVPHMREVRIQVHVFITALENVLKKLYLKSFQQSVVDEFMQKIEAAKQLSEELSERVDSLSEYIDD